MIISSHIFEAFLKCPMKCWFEATGEDPNGNIYAEWLQAQAESYRLAEAKRLLMQIPSEEYDLSPCGKQGNEIDFSAAGEDRWHV